MNQYIKHFKQLSHSPLPLLHPAINPSYPPSVFSFSNIPRPYLWMPASSHSGPAKLPELIHGRLKHGDKITASPSFLRHQLLSQVQASRSGARRRAAVWKPRATDSSADILAAGNHVPRGPGWAPSRSSQEPQTVGKA